MVSEETQSAWWTRSLPYNTGAEHEHGPLETQPHPTGAILNFLSVKEGCCQTQSSPSLLSHPYTRATLDANQRCLAIPGFLATNSPTLDGQWQLVPWLSGGMLALREPQ